MQSRIALAVILSMNAAALSQGLPELPTPPPAAPVREVVDEIHGTKVSDPYRYMENLKDPEVLGWMKSQSAYASEVIESLPGRKGLLERIKELDKGAPYTISGMQRLQNGTIFYRKLEADAETPVVASRPSVNGEEKLVLDPKSYETAGGSHASMEYFEPSPDGRFGVVGIAKGGSEVTTLYVRDLAKGTDLPVSIDRIETAYNAPQWLPDSSGFLYCRRQKLPPGAPASDTYKFTKTYLHKVGSPVEEDTAVFGKDLAAGIEFGPMDFPSVSVFSGSDYVIGQIHHGDSQELTLFSAKREALMGKTIPWKKICDVADGVIEFGVRGEHVYLVTSKDAPRYKIARTSLEQPDFAKAEIVLPESDLVLTSVHASKDAVMVNATHNGAGVVMQLDPTGKRAPERLSPPQNLTATVVEVSPFFSDVYVNTEAWIKGGELYAYDPFKHEYQASKLQPKGKYDDVPGYASKEVEVPSHDGALVPLSIIYKEGVKLDGSAPLILNGYGAYGIMRRVGYSAVSLAWLERGGIIAVAHVRGGGEKGKEWHRGGQMATKPNTWKDLIACSEYLIAKQYTSTPKLTIQGGSAGGILIGRSITERPDLFGSAIINVGCTDMMRFETTENGPPNVAEFGSSSTLEGFKALRAMSPLHNVQDGVKYPAVLLTHGLNDRRVDAWMSGKMTARLQAATASSKPVLLLLDSEAGHGIGSKRSQIQDQLASRWAFALWRAGEKDFQPAAAR